MELVQCIQNVYAHPFDRMESDRQRLLFKLGHVYPVFYESPYWMTQDEESERHIIADDCEEIWEDHWFSLHFRAL